MCLPQCYRIAKPVGYNERILMTTLKRRLKSSRMAPTNKIQLDVRNLRDENIQNQYKRKASAYLTTLPAFDIYGQT